MLYHIKFIVLRKDKFKMQGENEFRVCSKTSQCFDCHLGKKSPLYGSSARSVASRASAGCRSDAGAFAGDAA